MLEKQKAENQAKMLQIQGELARAKARARVYEDYSQMEVDVDSEVDEVESNVYNCIVSYCKTVTDLSIAFQLA